jgi:hypothetical protein
MPVGIASIFRRRERREAAAAIGTADDALTKLMDTGADLGRPRALLRDAEEALRRRQYDRARKLAAEAERKGRLLAHAYLEAREAMADLDVRLPVLEGNHLNVADLRDQLREARELLTQQAEPEPRYVEAARKAQRVLRRAKRLLPQAKEARKALAGTRRLLDALQEELAPVEGEARARLLQPARELVDQAERHAEAGRFERAKFLAQWSETLLMNVRGDYAEAIDSLETAERLMADLGRETRIPETLQKRALALRNALDMGELERVQAGARVLESDLRDRLHAHRDAVAEMRRAEEAVDGVAQWGFSVTLQQELLRRAKAALGHGRYGEARHALATVRGSAESLRRLHRESAEALRELRRAAGGAAAVASDEDLTTLLDRAARALDDGDYAGTVASLDAVYGALAAAGRSPPAAVDLREALRPLAQAYEDVARLCPSCGARRPPEAACPECGAAPPRRPATTIVVPTPPESQGP